ncbi:MAG: PilZ domain [Acidobacteriota bacterium]|nr:PilZ domain [Acidobacteriota bacterium]
MDLMQQHQVERRKSPRFVIPSDAPLVVGVAILGGAGRLRTFTGRVRDISATGLGIVLPTGEPCGELAERDCSLAVVFKLSSGVVKLRAKTARCNPLDELHVEDRHVAGVRITEISAQERSLLDEYLCRRSESK